MKANKYRIFLGHALKIVSPICPKIYLSQIFWKFDHFFGGFMDFKLLCLVGLRSQNSSVQVIWRGFRLVGQSVGLLFLEIFGTVKWGEVDKRGKVDRN